LCFSCAGTVDQVGSRIDDLQIGDRVSRLKLKKSSTSSQCDDYHFR
jgi:NADPH:quinone reductase-like Zn-dependent oxidoreductase